MMETRLVTAVDIAAARVRSLPTGELGERLYKTLAYQQALYEAKAELSRGEWILPAEATQATRERED